MFSSISGCGLVRNDKRLHAEWEESTVNIRDHTLYRCDGAMPTLFGLFLP